MLTYSSYKPSDSNDAVALWNQSLGDRFPMDLRLWEQNVNQSAFLWADASLTARSEDGDLIGLVICKKPTNINCIIVSPDHRRKEIGSKLFQLANEIKQQDDVGSWIVGQDRNHFFPGVPTDSEDAIAFFERGLKFQKAPGLITDLKRSLLDFEIEPKVAQTICELSESGIVIAPCREQDVESLTEHIASNFSARWSADTALRLKVEGNPAEIMVARNDSGVIGFAHTFTKQSKYLGPSVYWRRLLGENYGGLGPIGVDKDHRKIGLGLALLAASIQHVKDMGATEMAIDWTVLVDFYAKVGFSPWKTYFGVRQD